MTGHLFIREDGIEIRGRFRTHFFRWRDVAGFWLREGNLRGGFQWTAGAIFESPDEGWVTVRGGEQHRLRGISTYAQVLALNDVLERGRNGPVATLPSDSIAHRRGFPWLVVILSIGGSALFPAALGIGGRVGLVLAICCLGAYAAALRLIISGRAR